MSNIDLTDFIAETLASISDGVRRAQDHSFETDGVPIAPPDFEGAPLREGDQLVRFSIAIEAASSTVMAPYSTRPSTDEMLLGSSTTKWEALQKSSGQVARIASTPLPLRPTYVNGLSSGGFPGLTGTSWISWVTTTSSPDVSTTSTLPACTSKCSFLAVNLLH